MIARDNFSSRFGFVLAAAGSAVGLGNIWGFPTQVANHGGGAFLFVYIIVTILLAVPALFAELLIGYHAKKNPVQALEQACDNYPKVGRSAGYIAIFGVVLMLSFYCIVAGWMLANAFGYLAKMAGLEALQQWLVVPSTERNLIFSPIFIILTGLVIYKGVSQGIEKWSQRFMPLLIIMLVGLVIYIATLPGASAGFETYLIPDFSKITDPNLLISAMGQAFFSLSIGIGSMMIYGSYLKPGEKIYQLGFFVAGLDTLLAFTAGLLIIPALFVAQQSGVEIYQNGQLVEKEQLIFTVLPALFDHMGNMGLIVGMSLFFMLSIAALTSTISMQESPVAYLVEQKQFSRAKATLLMSLIVAVMSLAIIANASWLFGIVATWVTNWQLPLMGLFYFIVIGWLWRRGNQLAHINTQGKYRIFALYIRFVCPILMSIVFLSIAF